MSTTASLAARLEGTIGRHRVVSSEEELAEYVVDGIVPGAIVKPHSAEEAREVMRFAAADKLALIPVGSRSKCDIGMPPARYDIALDMTGMREIAHYDAGDLTLSVDAGTPLRQLEHVLAESQQFLPLAVPCFESSTVGGAIASGIDSVLRQQYGTARDFLIGAEFVDGKGNICKSGGRVVKNVTGYDLHKLLIGSLGTIGVITRLNFRTFPLAAAYGGHVASFESAERALAFRNAVEASGLPVANLEFLSPRTAAITKAILEKEDRPVPGCVEGSSWAVYASFEGNERVVERVAQDVERLVGELVPEVQPLRQRGRTLGLERFDDQCRDRVARAFHERGARLDAGGVEQIVDEPERLMSRATDRLDGAVAPVLRAVGLR